MVDTQESNTRYVVLIEDEEILSNILADKLRRMGYRVETAFDGEAGYELIEKSAPDLVLLDMMLPKLNGFGVLERLHEAGKLPALPVIVISNSGQPVEIERAEKLGIRDYLVKLNFDPDEVLEKVREVFGESGETAQTVDNEEEIEPEHHTSEGAPAHTGEKANVLVVEDDLFIADLLGRKLHTKFTVHQAGETKSAEDILSKNPIDIICLDIMLPGEDGYSFLTRLKSNEERKHIPVLMLSNLGQQEEIEKGLSLGAADYLVKANMSPDEILERVEEVLAA